MHAGRFFPGIVVLIVGSACTAPERNVEPVDGGATADASTDVIDADGRPALDAGSTPDAAVSADTGDLGDTNISYIEARRRDGLLAWPAHPDNCVSNCARTLRVYHPRATNSPFDVNANIGRLFIVFEGYIVFERADGVTSIARPLFDL